jgi:hypothetical protein
MALSKGSWRLSFRTMIPLSRATIWMDMHFLLWGELLFLMPLLSLNLSKGTQIFKHSSQISCLLCSMDFGVWTENSRSTYNKWDGVARSTTQVLLSCNCHCKWLYQATAQQVFHWKAIRERVRLKYS